MGKTKKTEKVTRKDLRKLAAGESQTFILPEAKACDAGKVCAYQLQNILKCKFSVKTNYTKNQLTITRLCQ